MLTTFAPHYIDLDGSLLHGDSAGRVISVAFAKIESCPAKPNERRLHQSRSARQLLSQSLHRHSRDGVQPSFQLEKSHTGKPFLVGENAPSISLAHSKNWVACVVANIAHIGIDIETQKKRDWKAYSQDVFHAEEVRWVLSGTAEEQNIRGLTCWCRKEAMIKALGADAQVHLSEIAFSPEGKIIALPPSLGALSGWTSFSHTLLDQAVLAVVWKS